MDRYECNLRPTVSSYGYHLVVVDHPRFLDGLDNVQDGKADFNRLCSNMFKHFHSVSRSKPGATGSICFNGTGPTFEVFNKQSGQGFGFVRDWEDSRSCNQPVRKLWPQQLA